MNHVYRLKRTGRTQQLQPVPENARSAGKGASSSGTRLAQIVAGTLASFALSGIVALLHAQQAPPVVSQLPQGGVVSRGSANINTSTTPAGKALMTVNQTSNRAVIDWNSFNVGSGAKVQFNQPSSSAVVLNQILGNNASQIYGQVSANGQVFLSNPNGIYFSPTAQVDVGGLVATTGKANADDFMAGRTTFNRDGATGSVVNEGQLSAALRGYIALLAPEVRNQGVIVAQAGTVALASGEAVTLNFNGAGTGLAGITTTPQTIAALVENRSAVLAEGGYIVLSAHALASLQGSVVRNSGQLSASSLSTQGGKIVLMADSIELTATSRIDANGPQGGGTVLVGGDWQGSGAMRQAVQVSMAQGASIEANATDNGDGGKVVLWSDIHNAQSVTRANGSIKAEAGPHGGNGGQIETSGHLLNVDDIQVSTQANAGNAGEWLLDPYDITIGTAAEGTTWAAGTVTAGVPVTSTYTSATTSTIQASSITNALATNNVTIQTGGVAGDGNGSGDININGAVSWAANNLTLKAHGSIYVNAVMTATNTASLYLNYGLGAVAAGNTSVIKTNMGGTTGAWTGKINLPSGNTHFKTTQGSNGTQKSFRVITDWAGFSALSPTVNNALGADIDAGNATTGHLSTITSGNTLDGLGHNISNLNITGLGLFFKIQASTIQNLGLVNIAVTADRNGPAGVLVGTVSTGSVVRNSFTTGSVNSSFTRVGGLVGLVETGKIIGSYTKANVSTTATGTTVSAGGLVGNFMIGSIANSFATGSVTANGEQVGGLIGYADPDYYSSNFGNWGNSITNSYALGDVSGTRSVGGLIGKVIYNAGAPLTLTNNYANGKVTGTFPASNAGLIGSGSNSIIRTGNYWNTTTSGQSNGMGNANVAGITGLSTAQMQDKTNFTGFEFTTNPVWFMPTAGTPLTPKLCLFEANCGIVQVYLLPVSGQSSTYGTAPTLSYCYSSSAANCSYVTFTGIPGTAQSYSLTDGLVSKNENIVGGVTGTIALTGNPSIAAAGLVSTTNARTYALTLTPSLTLAGYSFLAGNAVDYNINKANLTQVNATKVYDRLGTVTSAQMTNITGVLGQTFSATAGTATISDANVLTASKTITSLAGLTLTSINGGLADNYFLSSNLPAAGAQNSVDISAKALTVNATTVANKTYNATTAATLSDGTLVGVIAADDASVTLTQAGTFANKTVGTAKVVTAANTIGGAASGNYSLTQPTGLTADITLADLAVTGVAAANKVYTGTTTATLTGTAAVSGFAGDVVSATGTGAGLFADKNVGNGKAVTVSGYTLTGTDAGNYTAVQPTGLTANITAAALSVTANNASKTFDSLAYSGGNGVAYSGFVNSETSAVLGGALSYAGTAQGATNVNTYAITPQGWTSSNYAISYVNGALTINPVALVPVVGSLTGTVNKVYTGTTTATLSSSNYSLTGWVGTDGATVTKTTGNYANKNIGSSKAVTVNLLASDYSATGATNLSNYSLPSTITGNVGSITAASLSISGVTAADRVYTGTTTATLTGTAAVTGLAGDVVSASVTGAGLFADKNVGNGKAVTVSGYTLTGTDAGNYTAVQPTGLTANISKAPLAVTAANASKIYGDAIPTLTSVVSGFVGGESLATSGVTGAGVATTTATTTTPVGTAAITAGAGNLAAGNYSFNLVNGTLTVTSVSVPDNGAEVAAAAAAAAAQAAAKAAAEAVAQAAAKAAAEAVAQAAAKAAAEVIAQAEAKAATEAAVKAADMAKLVLDQVAGLSGSKAGAVAAPLDTPVKPEQTEKTPSAELAVMGSNQTQSQFTSVTAPTPVAAPVALARTGVLAVTILQGNEGSTTLASVAFEQNQTTTSIEASAPPSVLFKAAKVEFTDKLTTFMVAAPNGEMVEFQGGVVNNRMVIMASSAEAKRVAQSELNLVLAAAVISLGKESRVMLAQLDGVVLDLR